MMGRPRLPDNCLEGAAYTLSASGTALMFELGAKVLDSEGKRLAPVEVVLESDSRKPAAKHEILEMYVRQGLQLPDTPRMAVHRGRIDLLEKHLGRAPDLLQRTFTHEEIYPPELGFSGSCDSFFVLPGASRKAARPRLLTFIPSGFGTLLEKHKLSVYCTEKQVLVSASYYLLVA